MIKINEVIKLNMLKNYESIIKLVIKVKFE